MSSGLPFRKMSGLGNEILIIDLRPGDAKTFSSAHVQAIAQQPRCRFDQMMVLQAARSAGTEAFVRIYNADGSEAEACGNGMRCVGWLEAERSGRRRLEFETKAGRLQVEVSGRERICVDMGTPRFGWREIPLAEAVADTRAIELEVGPSDKPLLRSPSVVNVGNPHAVFWVDDELRYDPGLVGLLGERRPGVRD